MRTASQVRLLTPLALAVATHAAAQPCTLSQSAVVTFHFGVEATDAGFVHVLDIFHTDLCIPRLGGQWTPGVRWDSPQGEMIAGPDEALLYVNPAARVTLPSIPPGFEFIGATPGEPFWVLPQNPNPAILYLGISSEAMSAGDLESLCAWNPQDPRGGADVPAKWLRARLVDVRGPSGGNVSLWQSGIGPPTVYFSTHVDGVDAADVIHTLAGGHGHMNWAFTRPGLYEIDLRLATVAVNLCPADLDGDGHVGQSDLGILLSDYGCRPNPDGCPGDTDGDGATGQSDLGVLLSSYGTDC